MTGETFVEFKYKPDRDIITSEQEYEREGHLVLALTIIKQDSLSYLELMELGKLCAGESREATNDPR